MSWATPGFDDSHWDRINIPVSADENYDHFPPMFWFRGMVRLDLTSEQVNNRIGRLAVTIGAVESAYEIYAGGKKLGGVGLLPPEAVIEYDRHAIYAIPREAETLRLKVGYMTQKFSFWEDLSIAENLEFVARIYEISDKKRRVAETIARLGLTDRQRQLAGELSGG